MIDHDRTGAPRIVFAAVCGVSWFAFGCSESTGSTAETTVPADADGGPAEASPDVSSEAPGDVILVDTTLPEGSDECPGGCDEGQICSHGQCVPLVACDDDNDCSNDSYCDPEAGCLPWGTPPDKTHDPNCAFLIPPGILAPTVRCEFSEAPEGDPFPRHLDVQATPAVVNFHHSASAGPPSIVAPFTETVTSSNGSYTEGLGVLRVLRGTDCSQEAVLGGVDLDNDGAVDWIASPAPPAVGDLDLDGVAEIVTYGGDGSLLAFTRKMGEWSLLWKGRTSPGGSVFVDPLYNWTPARSQNWAGPSIHDLDDDGSPEVIREGYVFSARGILLSGLPPGYGRYAQGATPVLANLDSDPAIELTNGQYVWEWVGGAWVLETGFPGSSASAPGFVAVADFGAYGADAGATQPEIVVVRGDAVMVYALDGALALAPIVVPGGGGGNPTIADYDGDGLPELGVAGRDFYSVYDIDCTQAPRPIGACARGTNSTCDDLAGQPQPCPDGILWSRKTQDSSSRVTGSSVFDFEADGKAEVVYADECFVRVYNGTDGHVLFSQYRSSCTWYENPVVADADGNYRADLVVPSNLACSDGVSGKPCDGLEEGNIDPQFAGLRCDTGTDCVSGVCEDGLCRCSSSADCCPARMEDACEEDGVRCASAPTNIGGENTCRAVHPHGVTGIRVYSDALDRWVRSRTIWSQHAYAVTHIHENGTVPRTSEWLNNWEQPTLNNFRQNVPGTQNGQSIADATAGASNAFFCDGTEATLQVQVCNRGADAMGAGIAVGFYADSELVCHTATLHPLEPGTCETVSCTWLTPPSSAGEAQDITVIADDTERLTECKDGNNKGMVFSVFCKPPA